MSQVIVEEDSLVEKRRQSANQEHKIRKEDLYVKWHKTGTQGLDMIEKSAGLAFLPVAFVWGVILAGMGIALNIVGRILNAIGLLIRKK